MAFRLFILYIVLVFLRPIEQFAPDLMALRPMLILWALTFVSSIVTWRQSGLFAAHGVQIRLLLLFWFAIIVSLVLNGQSSLVGDAFGEFSTSAMLLFLVALNVTSLDRLKTTCKALCWSILLLCIQAIHSYKTGYMIDTFVIRQLANENVLAPEGLVLPDDDVNGVYLWRMRSVGFLQDPNDFAQIICMVLPWLYLNFRPGAWIRNLIWVGAPAAVMLYAIQLTHSRGGLVGLAVIVFVQVLRRIGMFWGAMLGVAGAMGILVIGQIGGRGFNAKEASANERLDAWFSGIEMFKSSPLFGVGYGQFMEHHLRTAHNSFVLCFAELGTFGYLCWLGLIVLAFRGLMVVAKSEDRSYSWWGWMMTSSLAAFLSCAWFLSRTYQASLFMLLGLSFACYFGYLRRNEVVPKGKKPAAQPLPGQWVGWTLGLYAASLIGVSMFVRAAK